ncbi:MAG: sodium:calcium antiporter [Acidimicrobiales bacterium]
MTSSILVFLASLALSVISSLVLAESLDRVGERLGFSEGLLGIVTALGADAPEISAAITALHGGRAALGFGVVLGSNVFNLAALLGLSAVIAGRVRVHRPALALNGGASLAATVLVAALLFGAIGPGVTVGLLAAVLVPYLVLLSKRPPRAARPPETASRPGRRRQMGSLAGALMAAVEDVDRDLRRGETPPRATRQDFLTVVPALVAVVLGSIGMVHASVHLGHRWHVPDVLVGTLVLASLTGIPNVIAAVRLALRHRGSAVVSESFNSNTINLLAGIALPTLVVGTVAASGLTALSAWWLIGMTVLVAGLAGYRGGLARWEGAAIIAVYAGFVAVLVVG